MTISESDRRDIFVGLEPILGPEAANNLLAMLPNQPAAQLVTRDDMHANTIMLRGEMAELRAELKGDMANLRSDLKADITDLRLSTQRWMSGAMAANTVALIAALVT
jgi:hypothetical protein